LRALAAIAWTVLLPVALAAVGCASVLGIAPEYVLGDGGDGDGEAPRTGIRCGDGGTFCDPATEECCLSQSASTLSCGMLSAQDPCPNGTDIPCDDSADCKGGQACCIDLDSQDNLLGTRCASSCAAIGGGGSWLELCAPSGGSSCASGTCQALGNLQPAPPFTPTWFYACQ